MPTPQAERNKALAAATVLLLVEQLQVVLADDKPSEPELNMTK